MVDFVLFNEFSLPLNDRYNAESKLKDFLYLIKILKDKNVQKIRFEEEFKNLVFIGEDITFQQFLGSNIDKDLKAKFKLFITNNLLILDSPLIKDNETENDKQFEIEYFYKDKSTIGGLACSDLWNTLAISFDSSEEWKSSTIKLKKDYIDDNSEIIYSRNISRTEHFDCHNDYFIKLEKSIQENITVSNFWTKKDELFTQKIIICDEVKKQLEKLDSIIFKQMLGVLRDIENGTRKLQDFNVSDDSNSVKKNDEFRKHREFYVNNKKEFFGYHIKNFSDNYRIHYFEKDDKIFIGYMGKHLPTKKFKN